MSIQPNTYLVAVSIGPVQSFIAAARRTRDLWFGSYLLSDLSRIAALALRAQQSTLVFPGLDDSDLGSDSALVVNKLVALIQSNPSDLMTSVSSALSQRWSEHCLAALDEAKVKLGVTKWLDQEIWNLEIENVVELFWAAVPLSNGDYAQALGQAETLLSYRKNTRDFFPSNIKKRVPKSSLDGAHETVFIPAEKLPGFLKRKMRLSDGEQLDAVGLVKRVGKGDALAEQFTPTTRIAIDPWVRAAKSLEKSLDRINTHYDILPKHHLATRVRGNSVDGGDSIYSDLPFDGALLFPGACDLAIKQFSKLIDADESVNFDEIQRAIEGIRSELKHLKLGSPAPYFALIQADGDRMGELLSAIRDLEGHRTVSNALASFSQQIATVVQKYYGHRIYSGGDDVLALIPIDQVFTCADQLRCLFEKILWPVVDAIAANKQVNLPHPTLSVGIAIAHMSEPLSVVRTQAKQAEHRAKNGNFFDTQLQSRNGVCISIKPRSGSPIIVQGNWGTGSDPVPSVLKYASCFRDGALARGFAHELQLSFARFEKPEIRKLEMVRVLNRKRESGGLAPADPVLVSYLCEEIMKKSPETILAQLLAARWMSAHVS
jgi:CRISPR-associated protein Cmr2